MKITDRKFGIEIEAFGVSTYRVQDALRAAGLNAEVEGYNHITRSHWKITSDASINGRNAFELVSPILQGQNGLRQLKKACKVLNDLGAQVNVSCGLHVHLDSQEMNVDEILSVYNRYCDYTSQIDQVVSPSRRGEGARYVSQVKRVNRKFHSKRGLARHQNKYRKVNLVNIASRGSIEFRQHQGTTDYTKISNWLSFLMQFVEASRHTKKINSSNRVYKQIRNVLENNGYEMNFDRGWNEWYARNTTDSNNSFWVSNDELNQFYTGARESSLSKIAFLNWLKSDKNIQLEKVTPKYFAKVVVEDAQEDTGWLMDIDEDTIQFLEQRKLDLS
mgnify:FL=1|tara:strand:- start:784 stop:1779 length:996 start_codon:yes stop_codon:yes gene_type:complete